MRRKIRRGWEGRGEGKADAWKGGGARRRGCAVWNLTSIAVRCGSGRRQWVMGTGDGGGGEKDLVG